MIGERSAEELKLSIGSAYKREEEEYKEVRGRNLLTGLPITVNVSSTDMIEALKDPIQEIVDTVHSVLERTPPELAADISNKGIILTGGGALLYGLDKLIAEKTGIPVKIANEPISCVARGTGKALDWIHVFENDIIDRDSARKFGG